MPKIFKPEEYLSTGEEDEVKGKCPTCDKELVLSHFPSYTDLIITETRRCLHCDKKLPTLMHQMQ